LGSDKAYVNIDDLFFHDGIFEKLSIEGSAKCVFSLIVNENINSSKKNRVIFTIKNMKKIILAGEFDEVYINSLSSTIQDGRIVESFAGKKISLQLIGGYFECVGNITFVLESLE